ncbi:hypothetical protein DB30_04435 [Enhygromyxa salina]|uniref:SMP-30/Gluconolactonase/LRE-like region domain-containing protein n=1 Tax=Enhygromyxa salina TaxID=215803 RepID=A0A0C2D963_9BACT|nr:hypothetical protein DB30_04435 [Enhygromyxa salina]
MLVCLGILTTIGCGASASDTSSETSGPGSESGAHETDETGSSETSSSETSSSETEGTDTDTDPNACWTDLEFGQHEVLYDGFSGGSEGIAFGASDGLLYASSHGRVWRVSADGSASEFTSIPHAVGFAAIASGGFVVASIGEFGSPDGAVYAVDPSGDASILAAGIDNANFVVIAPDGSALVSDDLDTRIFRVTSTGEVTVVIQDVPSPNGMGYSPDGASFYVASTFTQQGQLTRFDVGPDGLPIEASAIEIMHLGMGSTPDGIAIDVDNMVYVAANLRGEIWRIDGSVSELSTGELVADELGFVASLAFGRGPGFDPCSLYATQLSDPLLQRVYVGVRGSELYY